MNNKEYGSNFHLESESTYIDEEPSDFFKRNEVSFFLSGRAALYHLIKQGMALNDWKRVYFPNYYCHEVIRPLRKLGIEIKYYNFNPFTNVSNLNSIKDNKSSVFINVNFFNLIEVDHSRLSNLIKIDDLTYNFKGVSNSKADYCFGSLRKELPITVGGFCSSPKNLLVPSVPSTQIGLQTHRNRLLAMSLKNRYLNCGVGEKNLFLKLFNQSELALDNGQNISGMPEEVKHLFSTLKIEHIIERKRRNIRLALNRIVNNNNVLINLGEKEGGFGLVFYFNYTKDRDRLRNYLIENNVYPAILWPNQKSTFARNIERRVLLVHVDYRYGDEDIKTIVKLINHSI